MILDTRVTFGTRDLRTQRDADQYAERLWKARVRLNEYRRRQMLYFGRPYDRAR